MIRIDGRDVTHVPVRPRGVGFVFQHYAAFKHMTVADNVAFGLTVRKRPKAEIKARVAELLELVGLAHLAGRLPAPALRRPAPAHGARPRARGRAAGAAARRAVRRARRPRARGAAHLAAAAARRGARDDDLRHARPGGGDGDRRADRRRQRGPDRAVGVARRRSTTTRRRVRHVLRRPGHARRRPARAPARRAGAHRAGRGDRGRAVQRLVAARASRCASSCSPRTASSIVRAALADRGRPARARRGRDRPRAGRPDRAGACPLRRPRRK